jgi:fatty-acyl-CoA synthase
MTTFRTIADVRAIEAETPWEARGMPATMHRFLTATAMAHGARPALSYQLTSGPADRAETLTWTALLHRATQAANLFRSLGVGPTDVVAYVMPNAIETAVTLLGGAVAGIVNPVNPLLEPDQIAAILRETKAKVVVTLKAFVKTDVPQKVAKALENAPDVQTVLEVDLARYLPWHKRQIINLFLRPQNPTAHGKRVLDFTAALDGQPRTLTFDDPETDRVAAYFHTGGTTGMPKVAQHKVSGMVYQGWVGHRLLFKETDTVLCPLPLFHVFAAYPIMMSMIASGAHAVFPTPAGYRGEGVFDNFWKLIERWGVTYMIGVPTALSALMQRQVNARITTLRGAFSGSAPLPVELYNRFKEATGVEVVEGYGLTEATCLVSCNPPDGVRKIGSVGLTFPYTDVRILLSRADGIWHDCAVDEVGEICISNPGVWAGHTYTEADKNRDLFADGTHLRTGDLGRIDADGYLWITGRAKDLIIRGGHNIDPATIEDALMAHPAVAMVGAIGQPDAHAGELPAAYVELVKGATATVKDLADFAAGKITERAAVPKYLEILPELPKTAVGKVFKPDLRRLAITRVYNADLKAAGVPAEVAEVVEDKKRGLVARLRKTGTADDAAVRAAIGSHTRPWEWAA